MSFLCEGCHLLPSQLPGEHTGHKAASRCSEPTWNTHYSSTHHQCWYSFYLSTEGWRAESIPSLVELGVGIKPGTCHMMVCCSTNWAIQIWTQSPSPTWQKHWVTFTEGRAPLLGEESLERDARVDEAHWLLQLTWQTERALHAESDWSRAEGGEGEEELECLPLLEPHLQELLSEEESFPAGAEVGDCFLQTLTPNNPEPSVKVQNGWLVLWSCCRQLRFSLYSGAVTTRTWFWLL